MEILFVTRLAWVFGILATLLLALRAVAAFTYSELHRLHDKARGIERTFPMLWPAIIAVVCWTWIFTAGL